MYLIRPILLHWFRFLKLHSWKPQSQTKLENWPGVSLIKVCNYPLFLISYLIDINQEYYKCFSLI